MLSITRTTIACVLLMLAMTATATARPLQDLRSPDARDAAAGIGAGVLLVALALGAGAVTVARHRAGTPIAA